METTLRTYQSLVEACGQEIYRFDLAKMIEGVKGSIGHTNRFVREVSYNVIQAIFVGFKGALQS